MIDLQDVLSFLWFSILVMLGGTVVVMLSIIPIMLMAKFVVAPVLGWFGIPVTFS